MNENISGLPAALSQLKIEDDLLIIIFSIIALLLAGIIFIVIRSMFFMQSIERQLGRKLRNKQYSEVIKTAKDYIGNKPARQKADLLFVLYYLAQAYESTESLSLALKYYIEASVLAVNNKKLYISILLHIARIYSLLDKPKEALSYYLMLLEHDENHCETLYDLARIQYKNKNLKKAREYLEKLLSKRGGLIDARFLYGKILFENGSHGSALKQFELLEKYDSNNIEVFYYKAKTLESLKKYREAKETYQNILARDWQEEIKTGTTDINNQEENNNPVKIKENCQIAIINLFIKIKDYNTGIRYVSDYLSKPSSEETKTELMYLYANLLWNTGEEFSALKNFERVYMMKPDYKDSGIMYERFKKIIPHSYLANYFTSNEENEDKNFDSVCNKILSRHHFNLMYKHQDFYVYSKGVFFVVFYRHIEPVPFSKLTDMEVIMNSYEVKPQNVEIYSISGVREDAVTHFLLKITNLIEGDEFIRTIKRIYSKQHEAALE